MGWGGRWEGGSGWGTHVHPWLIHVNEWQKPNLKIRKKTLKNTNSILETYVYIEILDTYNMFILLKVRQIDEYFDSLIEK